MFMPFIAYVYKMLTILIQESTLPEPAGPITTWPKQMP